MGENLQGKLKSSLAGLRVLNLSCKSTHGANMMLYMNRQAVTKSYFGDRRAALYCPPGIKLTFLSCGQMALEVKVVKTSFVKEYFSYVSGVAARPLTE